MVLLTKNMKLHLSIVFLITFFSYSCTETKDTRPNIIVVLVDDMGFSDLSFFGSEINTPNIDALAEKGIVMNQFYNTGRCCPSRASLLTGLYQHQAGMGHMVVKRGLPGYLGYLNDSCVTIAEALKEANYTTYMVGKWHLGDDMGQRPNQRGFDYFYGVPEGGGVYWFPFRKNKKRTIILNEVEQPIDTGFYTTTAFNEQAVNFIKHHRDSLNPFFMYLAHIAPHFPLQALPEDIDKYKGKYMEGWKKARNNRYEAMVEKNIFRKEVALSDPDVQVLDWDTLSLEEVKKYDLKMAVYAAQMESLDRGIGALVASLKLTNQYENTIIMFMSDNGATHEQLTDPEVMDSIGTANSFTSYYRSWANVSNTPFRYYKHWVHEGGISSPLILHWPAQIKSHKMVGQIGHINDIMPTCLDLADTKYPDNYQGKYRKPMVGKSLFPMIKGFTIDDTKPIFWEHEGSKAVRKGKWKLVAKHNFSNWELYNMDEDRTELNNLASDHPDLVNELDLLYQDWAKKSNVREYKEIRDIRL